MKLRSLAEYGSLSDVGLIKVQRTDRPRQPDRVRGFVPVWFSLREPATWRVEQSGDLFTTRPEAVGT